MAPLHALVERGQREGAFRGDLPADWLVNLYFALKHGASGYDAPREQTLRLLITTVSDLYARSPARQTAATSGTPGR